MCIRGGRASLSLWAALAVALFCAVLAPSPRNAAAGPDPQADTESTWSGAVRGSLTGSVEALTISMAVSVPTASGEPAILPATGPRPVSALTVSAEALGAPAPPEGGLAVAAVPPNAAGRFIWPINSRRISTLFGPAHQAIDIDEFPEGGNPVRASAGGVVTFAGGNACCSYGLYVIVQHAGGYASLYAHVAVLMVSVGQTVVQGQLLGSSGSTGSSTGAHLHFALYLNHLPLDPLAVLPPGAEIE